MPVAVDTTTGWFFRRSQLQHPAKPSKQLLVAVAARSGERNNCPLPPRTWPLLQFQVNKEQYARINIEQSDRYKWLVEVDTTTARIFLDIERKNALNKI